MLFVEGFDQGRELFTRILASSITPVVALALEVVAGFFFLTDKQVEIRCTEEIFWFLVI